MNQDLKVAVLLMKIQDHDGLEIFAPIRAIIGITDENNLKMYDILGNQVYNNLDSYSGEDGYYGFYYDMPLKDFVRGSDYNDTINNLHDYMKEIKKKAYFYNITDGSVQDFRLKDMSLDDFNKQYGLTVTYPKSADNISNVDFEELNKHNRIYMPNAEEDSHHEIEDIELPPINVLFDEIKKNVLCQDSQIRKILIAIYKSLVFDNMKSNIFIYGPTGVGKTAILNQISKNLGLPMVIEDSTAYTIAGYKGKDCEDALRRLYMAAGYDIEAAEHGILVFDEVDKKHGNDSDKGGVSSDGVLNSLLKIIEGGTFEIDIDSKSGEKIQFDTTNLIVIVSGAFEKMLKQTNKSLSIGFNNTECAQINENNAEIVEKLTNYGMPKEFIGRFNTFVKLNPLTKDNLKKILLNSDSSVLKLYINNLNKMGINVKFKEDLIDRICDLAYSRNTGARALDNIISDLFEDTLFTTFRFDTEQNEVTLDSDILKEKKLVLKNVVK